MADLTLSIAGRLYDITCRDGDEPRLEMLAAMIDAKTQDARRTMPGINEVRQLLFAALFLADELNDVKAGGGAAAQAPYVQDDDAPRMTDALEALADRMESLAARLAALPENA